MLIPLKKLILPIILLVILAALAWMQHAKSAAQNLTFTTISGQKISMQSLQGKVVLVNFWATDCMTCNEEMPDLINTYNAYKAKGFEVIAISTQDDPPAQLQNYVVQKKLPFPVMHDGFGEMSQAFGGIEGTPTAFLFNKRGQQIDTNIGELDFAKLRTTLEKELG